MNAAQAVAFDEARTLRSSIEDAVRGAMGLGELAARFDLKFDDVVEAARLLMLEMYRFAGVRACRKCGCWEEEACRGGCSWAAADLCSSCVGCPARARWGHRQLACVKDPHRSAHHESVGGHTWTDTDRRAVITSTGQRTRRG